MRALLAALFLCLAGSSAVAAKPSPYGVTQFGGDRYIAHAEPQKRPVVRQRYSSKVRYLYKVKRAPASRARPMRADPPLTLVGGLGREVSRASIVVLGGRPSGCPSRFCGCGASLHLFGRIIPRLNLAANWLSFPRASPAPDMVAARRGHVFVLKRHLAGNTWLVHDSNSGRGRTRIHPRSIAGYAIVNPRGRV
jgi:hypothetical protein